MDDFSMADNAGMEQNGFDIPEDGDAAAEGIQEGQADGFGEQTELETDPQGTYQEEGAGETGTEESPAAADNSGDVTQTQAFSRRLRERTQQEIDAFVASQGYTNPYTGQQIRTKAEYDRYQQMYQAQQRGQDPVLSAQIAEMRSELTGYRLREQDAALQEDTQRGEIYRELRGEVLALVDYCRSHGSAHVDVNAAFNTVLSHRLPQILGRTKTVSEQAAVRRLTANTQASPGALGSGGEDRPVSWDKMSDAEFERYLAKAERGELRKG